MYDPTTAKFLRDDPLRLDSGETNFSIYAKNNPIMYSDPSGMQPEPNTATIEPPAAPTAGSSLPSAPTVQQLEQDLWGKIYSKGEYAELQAARAQAFGAALTLYVNQLVDANRQLTAQLTAAWLANKVRYGYLSADQAVTLMNNLEMVNIINPTTGNPAAQASSKWQRWEQQEEAKFATAKKDVAQMQADAEKVDAVTKELKAAVEKAAATQPAGAGQGGSQPPVPPVATSGPSTQPDKKGFVAYGPLDKLKRPTGAVAQITRNMIGTGSSADEDIRPPGWVSGMGLARGHLIGKQLGGSGRDSRNLVTMAQNPTNTGVMFRYENMIRDAVENGQMVTMSVTPIYNGDNLIPTSIQIVVVGNGGFVLNVRFPNLVKLDKP